jgi:hypothetical protein
LANLALWEELQPKLPPSSYGKAEGVIAVLRAMVVLLATLMQPSLEGDSHCDILELRTRLFMNAVEDFEKPLRRKKRDEQMKKEQEEQEWKNAEIAKGKTKSKGKPKKKKITISLPIWIEKYNFLSMLNLTEIVQHFGSPRPYFLRGNIWTSRT